MQCNNLPDNLANLSDLHHKQCSGMNDNLHLDYSNPTSEFKNASQESPVPCDLFANMVSPPTSNKHKRSHTSPATKLWTRLEDRVDKNLCLGRQKSELTIDEKNKRKIAKKVFESLNENKSNHGHVSNSIATSRGVPKNSLEDWVDGTMSAMEGKHFCSQDAVDYYINDFMSSDEE